MSTEYLNRFVELETTSGICTPNWIQTSKATLSDAPDKLEEIWRKKTTGLLRNLFINLNRGLGVNSFIEIGAHEASISIELKKLEIDNVYAFEANPFVYKKYASNLKELNISYGVKIKSITTGKLKSIGLQEGIIITKVNNEPIETVAELTEKLSGVNRGILLEIMDETGKRDYRGFGL